ncbi:MAG: hypothetical protein KJO36_02520, partial [Acidimicrobiia bacterium]|nr:hypothetical protein [Acidimicrobiia bacterium]
SCTGPPLCPTSRHLSTTNLHFSQKSALLKDVVHDPLRNARYIVGWDTSGVSKEPMRRLE